MHANTCLQHACLQRPGARLEHVGLLHHTPDARVAFLHRTAGGKYDPWVDSYKTADFVTLPLDPVRAHKLFQGTAELDNYRFPPERFATAAALAASSSSLGKVGSALGVLVSAEQGDLHVCCIDEGPSLHHKLRPGASCFAAAGEAVPMPSC